MRACQLEHQTVEQLSLFQDVVKLQRQEQLDKTVDSLRNRFGHFVLQKGLMLTDQKLANLNPKNDHVIHPESFFHT